MWADIYRAGENATPDINLGYFGNWKYRSIKLSFHGLDPSAQENRSYLPNVFRKLKFRQQLIKISDFEKYKYLKHTWQQSLNDFPKVFLKLMHELVRAIYEKITDICCAFQGTRQQNFGMEAFLKFNFLVSTIETILWTVYGLQWTNASNIRCDNHVYF